MDTRRLIEIQSKLQYGMHIDDAEYQTFVNTIHGQQPMMIPERYLEIIKEKYSLLRDINCANEDVFRAFLMVLNEYKQKFVENTARRPYMRWELQTALFDNWKGWMYPEPCGAVLLKLLSIVKPTRKRRRSLTLDACCGSCDCCE